MVKGLDEKKNHLFITENANLHSSFLTHFLTGPCSCVCSVWFYSYENTIKQAGF